VADDEKLEAGNAAAEAETPAAEPEAVAAEAPVAEAETAVEAPVEEAAAVAKPKATRTRKPKADTETETEAADAVEEQVVEETPTAAPKKAPAKAKAAAPKKAKAKEKAERGTYVRTPASPSEPGQRRERRGVVVSSVEDKTITVRVDVMMAHPKYKKIMRRSLKLRVHDEGNTANAGDVVRVVECKPMSKTKRWRLVEIVEVAK
jgi:small subunit ribosomal protein S17